MTSLVNGLQSSAHPLDRAVRVLLRQTRRLDAALERYIRADDVREPDDDSIS
jgi:hypothetical protein